MTRTTAAATYRTFRAVALDTPAYNTARAFDSEVRHHVGMDKRGLKNARPADWAYWAAAVAGWAVDEEAQGQDNAQDWDNEGDDQSNYDGYQAGGWEGEAARARRERQDAGLSY